MANRKVGQRSCHAPAAVAHLDTRRIAKAWADVFRSGCATFDDFPLETGVQMDRYGRVAPEEAQAAWNAYGPTFLPELGDEGPRGGPLWAMSEFGAPNAAA